MAEPQRFRKKPVEIEAMQWDGTAEGATPIIDWILAGGDRAARYSGPDDGDPDCPDAGGHGVFRYCPSCPFADVDAAIAIDTLEGTMTASPGDWIIRGVQGEFYPCKPHIFAETYENAGAPLRANVLVKVVPEGSAVTGPVIGTVHVETNDVDAVRDAIAEALRP